MHVFIFKNVYFLDTIENRIDHTVGSVEKGTEQLLKASENQKKRRWKLFDFF